MPGRILVIDDDRNFLESTKVLLESFGYTVATACDGTSGLARAKEIRPDLIVLDIMMAYDTEGLQVAREIRACPELTMTKVLLVSGIVSEKELPGSLEPDIVWLPVEKILDKPIDPDRLVKEIERVLGVAFKV